MSNKRLTGLVLVVLIHVLLAWAFISGLAIKAVEVIAGPMETFEVEEQVEVEEEPPPPPEQLDEIPPYVPPPDVTVESLPPPPAPVTTVRT
ncbi:MAG: energy transducer TonB, partial [Pacificimonas sp.]